MLKQRALFAYISVIVFGIPDSYYLQLERKYRILYDEIRLKNNDIDVDFDLNIDNINYNKVKLKMLCFLKCLFSKTEVLFYVPIIVTIMIAFGIC